MALLNQHGTRSRGRRRHSRTLGHDGRNGLRREGLPEHCAGSTTTPIGPTLHPGRLEAIEKMRIRPGDDVLEVGVGTGINLSLYPRSCTITGIDLSSKMLEKAQKRIDEKGLTHCDVMEMDATKLTFADNSFDVVYAPYVISVVPGPGRGGARDVPRLPSRRPRRHPQPLQERERDDGEDRDGDLADDRAHRLHGRSRSGRFPGSGRPARRCRSRRSTSRRSGRW